MTKNCSEFETFVMNKLIEIEQRLTTIENELSSTVIRLNKKTIVAIILSVISGILAMLGYNVK